MRALAYTRWARRILTPLVVLMCASGLAAERGAVTAIASLSSQVSAFVGFSSGAVLYCTRKGGCTELEGTSGSAVTAIDTPREGSNIRVWVGYEDGSVLFCTLTGGCIDQDLQAQRQIIPNRDGSNVKSRVPAESE